VSRGMRGDDFAQGESEGRKKLGDPDLCDQEPKGMPKMGLRNSSKRLSRRGGCELLKGGRKSGRSTTKREVE